MLASAVAFAAVPAAAASDGESEPQESPSAPVSDFADYMVVPETTEGESGDRVEIDVTAETLIGDNEDADVTGYELDIEYDDDKLVFADADTFLTEPEELEIDDDGDSVQVEWVPSFLDVVADEFIAEVADGEASPNMNVTLATLEFAVTGDPGETADIDITDDSTMWWGSTGISEYDDDNVWWGTSEVEIVDELDDDGPEDPDGPQVGEFTAVSQGNYIAFNEDESDREDEGVQFPVQEDGDTPIQIEGEIFDDGTWQSTDATFPTLDAPAGLEADVEVIDNLYGDIDIEGDEMTAEGDLNVIVDGNEDDSFEFEIGATTGESGILDGDASLGDDGGSVTLVDNEFLVEDTTGDDIVDSGLGLPSTQEGDNWLSLALDIEVVDTEVPTGTVEGTVESEDGAPIEGADVNVVDELDATQTGEDGAFEFELEAGTQELDVTAEGYVNKTAEVTVEEDETTERTLTLESGDAYFEAVAVVGDDVEAGEEAEILGTVENTGEGAGEQDVTLSVADEEVTETLEVGFEEETTIDLSWETDADDDGEYTAELDTGDATAEAEVTVSEADDNETDSGDDVLTATSQGGFIAFTEDTSSETTASDEGLSLPDEDDGDTPIELEADYNPDDNSWESTAVDFPNLDLGEAGIDGVEAEIDTPNGLEGTIDTDDNTMTVEGTLAVTAADGNFEFDIDATTDGSNDLDGDADLDADGGTITAVDNEYLIQEESGYDIMDNALDLPATTPGENWLTLSFDIDIEETAADTGDIEGTVESSTGDPIEDATVDIEDELDDTTTDDDGDFELDDIETGDYTLEITADGHADTTTDVTVDEDDTTTVDVELDADDPEMTVDVDVTDAEPGDTVALTATVENTGGAPGSEEVTATVGDETKTQTVEVAPGDTETVTLEWDVAEEDLGEHTAEIEGESFESTADVTVAEDLGPDVDADGDTFVATSQGGFISFAEDGDKETAIEEGLEFPSADAGEEPIEIVGAVDDDGSWESSSIRFPDLVTDSGIAAEVSAPDGLSGEIDADSGEMSANGELSVAIEGDDDTQFSFEIATTVGESESLSGEASLDEEGGTATLVDNEFTVPDETGDPLIDGTLDLPATDEGTNWFELDLEVELDADDDATSQQQQQNNEDESDEDGGEATPESNGGLVTSFGQLTGFLGLLTAGGIVTFSLATRLAEILDV